jgi:hypothetical protein
MTAKVIKALESIKDLQIFEESALAFIGGTALAYTLGHRISEDIDIICNKPLAYQNIITSVQSIGGKKLRDENSVALRMAGLFPDEHMLKFNLHGVKLEFFQASTPLQKEILTHATPTPYKKSLLAVGVR